MIELKEIPFYAFLDGKKHIYIEDNVLDQMPLIKYNDLKWKKLFPSSDCKNTEIPINKFKKLQLTEVGVYSIAAPDISNTLIEFVKELINKNNNLFEDPCYSKIKITETNGGIGGMSISLLKIFDNLNIVELNPTHYSIIKNNIQIYGYSKEKNKNINLYESNYLDKMLELDQDIIISDPPWGGRSFIKKNNIRLGFSNIDITYIINLLNEKKLFKIFIFLAPCNFDFNSFTRNINAGHIYIVKARKHNYIAVTQ